MQEQEILFLVNAFVRKHAAFQNKCVKAIESHKPDLEELDKSEKVSFAEIASFTKVCHCLFCFFLYIYFCFIGAK